ncbi:flagellar protein FlgN [Thalassovita sp.]|jgi:flagellar biosynthesis/type III secretory pathway chaperone|uniref:flagellar protein FlgN n=1 Tax=Thalassovita sp. TaxID=1979401 RepID=UPI003B5CE946
MQDNKAILRDLRSLLDEERQCLLSGELSKLPALLERKQALVDCLEDADDPVDLRALHDRLARNHTLLTSAMEGIQRVSNRLDTLKRLRKSLETYDSSGRRNAIPTAHAGKVEKRA